jgi:hypothetical protein
MKTLLTMVLTMGLAVSSTSAQEPPQRLTDCTSIKVPAIPSRVLLQQNTPKLHRGWLGRMDVSKEQWGMIKAERQKFGSAMKVARDNMMGQINIILTPEQQEALREQQEVRHQRADMRRGDRRGSRRSEWIAKREQRKEQHEHSKPETKTESTEKD